MASGPLPVRPAPVPGELPSSYQARLAAANGLTGAGFSRRYPVPSKAAADHRRRLATASGCTAEELSVLGSRSACGQVARHCLACRAEQITLAGTRSGLVVACPRHRRFLTPDTAPELTVAAPALPPGLLEAQDLLVGRVSDALTTLEALDAIRVRSLTEAVPHPWRALAPQVSEHATRLGLPTPQFPSPSVLIDGLAITALAAGLPHPSTRHLALDLVAALSAATGLSARHVPTFHRHPGDPWILTPAHTIGWAAPLSWLRRALLRTEPGRAAPTGPGDEIPAAQCRIMLAAARDLLDAGLSDHEHRRRALAAHLGLPTDPLPHRRGPWESEDGDGPARHLLPAEACPQVPELWRDHRQLRELITDWAWVVMITGRIRGLPAGSQPRELTAFDDALPEPSKHALLAHVEDLIHAVPARAPDTPAVIDLRDRAAVRHDARDDARDRGVGPLATPWRAALR